MSQVYPEAETMVQDEDSMPITEPIIKPIKTKKFSVLEKNLPQLTYSSDYMTALTEAPQLIRNMAIVGSLAHGQSPRRSHLLPNAFRHVPFKYLPDQTLSPQRDSTLQFFCHQCSTNRRTRFIRFTQIFPYPPPSFSFSVPAVPSPYR